MDVKTILAYIAVGLAALTIIGVIGSIIALLVTAFVMNPAPALAAFYIIGSLIAGALGAAHLEKRRKS